MSPGAVSFGKIGGLCIAFAMLLPAVGAAGSIRFLGQAQESEDL